RRGGQAGENTEDDGHREREATERPGDIDPRCSLGKSKDNGVRNQAPLGEPQVAKEKTEGQPADYEEEEKLGNDLPGEHDLIANFLEPPPVDQHAEQRRDEKRPGEEQQEERDQPAAKRHFAQSLWSRLHAGNDE